MSANVENFYYHREALYRETVQKNLKEAKFFWTILAECPCGSDIGFLDDNHKTLAIEKLKDCWLDEKSSLKTLMRYGNKIISTFQKYGFPCDHSSISNRAKEILSSSEINQCCFIIEPTKQKFDENSQFNYIEERLPKGATIRNVSSEKMYVSRFGEIVDSQVNSQSIDFEINVGGYTYFVFSKYLSTCGGSQTNQYNSLETFLDDASGYVKCRRDKTRFIGLIDYGGYFDEFSNKFTNLKDGYETKKVKVFSCEDLVEYMNKEYDRK